MFSKRYKDQNGRIAKIYRFELLLGHFCFDKSIKTRKGIGKQIAMHIAAANPASLSVDDLDSSIIDREKQILSEQARESGKPEAVIEKMITGRMNKFFEEVTLLNQKFVINPDITVSQAAADAGVEVIGFSRLEVGEGIEKEQEDFAAEVAKTIGG